MIDQSVFPEVDEVQLKKIDQQIAELQSSLKTLQSEYQAKESSMYVLWLLSVDCVCMLNLS